MRYKFLCNRQGLRLGERLLAIGDEIPPTRVRQEQVDDGSVLAVPVGDDYEAPVSPDAPVAKPKVETPAPVADTPAPAKRSTKKRAPAKKRTSKKS
jgi:hypothetical protein